MNRKWLLLIGAADLLILSLLDKVAYQHFFYWRFGWYDTLMHLIGGLAIGLVSSWVYLEKKDRSLEPVLDWNKLLFFNFSFALVIGLVWELFELVFDRIVVFSLLDSLDDLLFGMAGSLLAGLLVGSLKKIKDKS